MTRITTYIEHIFKRYRSGIAKEHAYRGDVEQLIRSLIPDIEVTNEPANVTDCGNPDFVITRDGIPIGYIEAKDVGKDLNSKSYKEQFDRYRHALDNLIITDYFNFHFYQNGERTEVINIAYEMMGEIVIDEEACDRLIERLKTFCSFTSPTIKSALKLAQMMAGKAKLLQNILANALASDEESDDNSMLKGQYEAFRTVLIHDLTSKEFADLYAQTLAYGMFAARLHDDTPLTFSRQEAAELIPHSNPFLRKMFQDIAGFDIDPRIRPTVDNLAEVFRHADVRAILTGFKAKNGRHDPIIHFYETFLSEYDPALRKARGVWYTPAPVVNFIVRAVDDILKSEFDLPQGLSDTSMIKVEVPDEHGGFTPTGKQRTKPLEVHRVQLLDPATGTGTFLAEVVKHIHDSKFASMQGAWSDYVEKHLIPRLNGFEILMASYAMAHLKLDLLLAETGYVPINPKRFNIFLTNSLEEYHPDTGTLFASRLAEESARANRIKRDSPVMCVIGNPPYSGESANKGEWIMSLMDDYKKEPGGKEKLKEKNSKFINDDYVKFLRYGQYFIEKNGEGILAFINPHGFLDNPTFRGMRWNLLKTYDKIYTLDLHGNSKKKEISPDGTPDVNIFDIMQGVAITIFVKTGKKKANELGKVFHYDLYGKREFKYDFLIENSLKTIPYTELPNNAPNYFFVSKNFHEQKTYEKGFVVNELFQLSSLGLLTKRDNLSIDFDEKNLVKKILFFLDDTKSVEEVCKVFDLVVKDKDKWDANLIRNNVPIFDIKTYIKNCEYRPFDNRKIFYNSFFVARPNTKVLSNFNNENAGLIIGRQGQAIGDEWNIVFTCKGLVDQNIYRRGGGTVFPLYLYPDDKSFDTKRRPNLNMEIVDQIAQKLGLEFVSEKSFTVRPELVEGSCVHGSTGSPRTETFAPIDILDYIYAVLHSPTYRETYKEFLKIDFPRVPYPKDAVSFWQLVKLGGEIRQIHLLESPVVENYITGYPMDGDNVVGKIRYAEGKVYINETQYFENVPEVAWNFYIGGYQPAQKWLKDRKDRVLGFEDILHYQKIIVALSETERIMREIDTITTY
jgi:predicted helicase